MQKLKQLQKLLWCSELMSEVKHIMPELLITEESSILRNHSYLNRYKLPIIDELGYLPIYKEYSNLFFQLIDMRYEKKSIILTININFADWDSVFYDAVVTDAYWLETFTIQI